MFLNENQRGVQQRLDDISNVMILKYIFAFYFFLLQMFYMIIFSMYFCNKSSSAEKGL